MDAKKVYNGLLQCIEAIPDHIELTKTNIAESIAIIRKRNIYKSVHWSKEEQEQFDSFWIKAYGKRISNKWHKLYEASSGTFAVDYIPEKMYTTKIEPAFNERRYAIALEDKSIIESFSYGCNCIVPDTLVVCSKGQLYDSKRHPISEIRAVAIINNNRFIIKPTVGSSSGRGIVFGDNTLSGAEIKKMLGEAGNDYIVQGIIEPLPAYSIFNKSSVNTLRIMTFIVNNEIHHVPLAFRIGRNNKRVDNIHAGGLVIGVTDQGHLLPYAYELGYGDKTIRYSKHPDSGIKFQGYQLPYVKEVIEAAYQVHGRYPHIGIVSWDFTIDKKGRVVLIEANIMGQSIWIPQMIHGKGAFGRYTFDVLREIK